MQCLKRKQSKNIEACAGYTRTDAQVRQPSAGYVVEKFDTALERVRRLVGIVPDVQVCIHENKTKKRTVLQRKYELKSVVRLRIKTIMIKIH